ncbi:MAG: hypothetical protein A2887_00640 [Alphaproteobacteria bacterium RIFCSPLOWO2_01_FULL_40_26]|nr:MAG: hypothetical protein A3D15_01010 [Alphaproteobacteria bacterium RIFCSPHIGHO2_02_FULL_40_34]OFW94695.1 MAG: hypothetical protein A2887_00640 [Alphaproteobacteria bacterium RIFCSPLOWO2_01_FULL_40_26]OFX10163.1 MAG: hypothetical protein A3H30_05100 [Alphaproteobacteria bacterium RIFCSPLOWO2_02_FULL_40_19]OFX11792.1 MAG: hypothetical protein A3G22_04690 [Alphaproteobacteria bacterium RIFCSPLOWO2_12_FULL_40_11]
MKLLLIFVFIFSFSCLQKPAQIVNRGNVVYNKNFSKRLEKSSEKPSTQLRNHEVEVQVGDTLYSLAKRHNITLRDLIKQNNLVAPYILKPGARLTIPAPSYHEVKIGDTLYSISRLYGMKLNLLVEMNDLQAPYAIKVGERLRIEKFGKDSSQNFRIIKEKAEIHSPNFIEKTLDKFNHFSWPVYGKVISKFGPKSGGLYNDGINISAKEGEVVKSSEDGVVAYVGNELKGYGNLIIVKHSGGWITAYAHLKDTTVSRGQRVKKGQKIATIGATGNVQSPQLYFGLRKGRDAVNPENYLK